MTTPTNDTNSHSSKELLEALAAARDHARVQWHLLSLDARDQWRNLEAKLEDMQSRIEREGERVSETATQGVHELTRSVRDFLREYRPPAGLGTPAGQLMKAASVCHPGDTLNDAARLMWELDCGAIPVVDDAEHLVGIVTDRDLCMAAYTRGQPLTALSVESTMSRHVVVVSPKDTLESVVVLMGQKQVRRILVVDNRRLVGIITLADVARHVESDTAFSIAAGLHLAHTLAKISESRAASSSAAE